MHTHDSQAPATPGRKLDHSVNLSLVPTSTIPQGERAWNSLHAVTATLSTICNIIVIRGPLLICRQAHVQEDGYTNVLCQKYANQNVQQASHRRKMAVTVETLLSRHVEFTGYHGKSRHVRATLTSRHGRHT